jgi:hypothetical protein
MKVHCRRHLDFCLSKAEGSRLKEGPMAEVAYINNEDKVENVPIGKFDRTVDGF